MLGGMQDWSLRVTHLIDHAARECGNRLVVTYNPYESGCLWLYPPSEWETVRDQVNALPSAKSLSIRASSIKS